MIPFLVPRFGLSYNKKSYSKSLKGLLSDYDQEMEEYDRVMQDRVRNPWLIAVSVKDE